MAQQMAIGQTAEELAELDQQSCPIAQCERAGIRDCGGSVLKRLIAQQLQAGSAGVRRQPGQSVATVLRAVDRGTPDFRKFRLEHGSYIDALEQAGLNVEVLPPSESFPDSVFVEDAALCLPQGSVILRPGTPSRLG